MIKASLSNGSALQKFQQMLKFQGVPDEVAEKLCSKPESYFSILPLSSNKTELKATVSGVVASFDSLSCAEVTAALGAGRSKPGEKVAHDVGLVIHFSIGEFVKAGDTWVTVHHKNKELESHFKERLDASINIDHTATESQSVKSRILKIIRGSEVNA